MKDQISYSTLGNELIHELRDKLSHSENSVDISHTFSYTVIQFLTQAFKDQNLSIDADDVKFKPDKNGHYTISDRLKNTKAFKEKWGNSDLPNVISKFAEATHHRYVHVTKHPEKTNKKIRN